MKTTLLLGLLSWLLIQRWRSDGRRLGHGPEAQPLGFVPKRLFHHTISTEKIPKGSYAAQCLLTHPRICPAGSGSGYPRAVVRVFGTRDDRT